MASTILLIGSDAFQDGLTIIIDWFNLWIDRLGLREYLPIIGLLLLVLMICKTLHTFMSSFDR